MTAPRTAWYVYARKAFDTRAKFQFIGKFHSRPKALKEADMQRKQGFETLLRKGNAR